MSRRATYLLVGITGLTCVALGAVLVVQVEDVFGDEFHPWGSLGLALVILGCAAAVVAAAVVVRPRFAAAAARDLRTKLDSPGRLLVLALGLAIVAAILISITADAGGFTMYHPFDFPGMGLGVIALVLALRSALGYLRRGGTAS